MLCPSPLFLDPPLCLNVPPICLCEGLGGVHPTSSCLSSGDLRRSSEMGCRGCWGDVCGPRDLRECHWAISRTSGAGLDPNISLWIPILQHALNWLEAAIGPDQIWVCRPGGLNDADANSAPSFTIILTRPHEVRWIPLPRRVLEGHLLYPGPPLSLAVHPSFRTFRGGVVYPKRGGPTGVWVKELARELTGVPEVAIHRLSYRVVPLDR